MQLSKRALQMLAPLSIVFLVAAMPTGDREDAVMRLDAILTALNARGCDTNCEFGPCGGETDHRNYVQSGGNDTGEVHTCATSTGGCGDHSCIPEDDEDVDALLVDELLSRLDGQSIREFERNNPAFFLNTERGAMQIVGCEGRIMVSKTLSADQIAELTDL